MFKTLQNLVVTPIPRLLISCESWIYLKQDIRLWWTKISYKGNNYDIVFFSWKIKYQVILWNATSSNRQAPAPCPHCSYQGQQEKHPQLNDNGWIFQSLYIANGVEPKRICLIVKEKLCLSRRISLKVCNSTHITFVLVLYSSWNRLRAQERAFRPNIIRVINHHPDSILKRNQEISLNWIPPVTIQTIKRFTRKRNQKKLNIIWFWWMRPKTVEDGYVVRFVYKETTGLIREWKYSGGKMWKKATFYPLGSRF